jgi:aspartate oxidase
MDKQDSAPSALVEEVCRTEGGRLQDERSGTRMMDKRGMRELTSRNLRGVEEERK